MDSHAQKWLTIIGIGEDGVSGLSQKARDAVAGAEIVMGGRRHLDLVASITRAQAMAWPSPFDPQLAALAALAGRRVCVLASGDPFFFGVGATIARQFPVEAFEAIPAPSSFSLAASRLGWALQETETVSLHGRPLGLLRRYLHPGRKLLVLTSDAAATKQIAKFVDRLGFAKSRLTLLENLGGPQERIRAEQASLFDLSDISPLNVLGIEVVPGSNAAIVPLTPGLSDSAFEHDGQLTKRDVRAATLAALAPRRGELLWDIGAGSGSIGIEWMLADPSMRAIAIETHPKRAARIRRNAWELGTPDLEVMEASAPEALGGLPPPDAIFIGGGGSDEGVMEAAIAALPGGGRLVANAVTLEMEAVLLALHAARGGELVRLAFSRAEPVGTMLGWRPAMPVTQWRWIKA
jgi:precorrin-6Y C5,15-methyltransferase (decarboxylating)